MIQKQNEPETTAHIINNYTVTIQTIKISSLVIPETRPSNFCLEGCITFYRWVRARCTHTNIHKRTCWRAHTHRQHNVILRNKLIIHRHAYMGMQYDIIMKKCLQSQAGRQTGLQYHSLHSQAGRREGLRANSKQTGRRYVDVLHTY